MNTTRVQTVAEEIANTVSHGFGAALAFAGVVFAVVLAVADADPLHIAAVAVYGATLVATFASSAVYHSVRAPGTRELLLLVDHACIYLLIAGSYTPYALVTLRGPLGWSLFALVWALATAGITFKALTRSRYPALSTALYALLGWVGVGFVGPLLEALPLPALGLLVGGGLAYTFGIAFYVWERLPYHHLVWHLFVLLGAALHFAAVVVYV